MTVGIARLNSILDFDPHFHPHQDNTWVLSKQLEEKKAVYYRPLILNHQVLTLEYNVLRNYLVSIYTAKNISQREKVDALLATLFLAEWLTFIYQHHLVEPGEVARLENDQRDCRNLLKQNGYNISDLISRHKQLNVSQQVRIKTREVNPLRLTFIRGKRVLDALVPIVKNLEQFRRGMMLINKIVNPILAYVAWLYFLPRLMINFFHLITHTISHPWMSEREKNLGFLIRFTAQLQQRWFEIGNDLVWSVAGLLACFVWLGPLAPVGIYINVTLYAYDVVLMGIRVAIDVWRLTRLQDSYQRIVQNTSGEQQHQAQRMLNHLSDKIWFDYKKLALALLTTIALLVAIVICLPSFAMSPFVPFAGACLLLAVTLINYGANKYLDKHEPTSTLQSLVSPPEPAKISPASNWLNFFKSTNDKKKPPDSQVTAEFVIA